MIASASIAETLERLTGSWKPSAASSADELSAARATLAAALASGLPEEAVSAATSFQTPAGAGDTTSLDDLLVGIHPNPVPTVLPRVRNATDIDPAASSITAGMKIDQTLGPFVDTFGVLHWIDLIPLPVKIAIDGTSGVLGYIIVDDPTTATIGAGSIWIAASSLGIPLLTSGFLGLSFSSGTITTTGAATIAATGITVPDGATLELQLTLAQPPVNNGTPPLGADARAQTLALPATVTIAFSPTAANVAAVGDASATVYGTSFSLARNAAAPKVVTAGFGYVLFPGTVSITEFAFATVASTDVVPSGEAAILEGGWAIPITTATPAQLGAAASAGSALLELGPGSSLRFGPLSSPTLLGNATIAIAPGAIVLAAANGPRAVTAALTLWDPAPAAAGVEPPAAQVASRIDLTIRRGSILFASISTFAEAAIAFGSASANVDRPLGANGGRLPLAFASALGAFVHTVVGRFAIVEMSSPPPGAAPLTIALENALLLVPPASSAVLVGDYQGSRLVGFLEFTFTNARVIPTLPDPYAAGNVAPIELRGAVAALASWTLAPGAKLGFATLAPAETTNASPASVVGVPPGPVLFGTTLLDLSSNVDQFGVSLARDAIEALAIEGITLALPQNRLTLYALPGISWEPVVNDATNDWYDAATNDDGPPIGFVADSVQLVAVQPDVAITAFANALADYSAQGQFSLPFGLYANVSSRPKAAAQPSVQLVKADYANEFSVARQLAIRATGVQDTSLVPDATPSLPGNTTTGTTLPITPTSTLTYGGTILSDTDPRLSATSFFEQEFSTQPVPAGTLKIEQVPVARIDVSGYGTSMFSDWANTELDAVGVTRARFDVLVGRTAYELVQIQSVIFPWCVRITETVIFERFDAGIVVRHDTGWKAVGAAAFDVFSPAQLYAGAVRQLTNVQNVVPTNGAALTIVSEDPDPKLTGRVLEFVPVLFDADVAFATGATGVTATSNGTVGSSAAGTQFLGYAQTTARDGASAIEVLQLMARLPNGVSGNLGCIVNVGGVPTAAAPQYTVNASSINVKASSTRASGETYPAAVAVALYGTPHLPRDGAWSITRRGPSDTAPTAVDPTQPIPLVLAPDTHGTPQWRLLDPSDVLQATTPATFFGLLQGTGSSKTLFENPIVEAAGKALSLDPAQGVPSPNLADIGALLGAADIFPDLANVLKIPTAATDALALVSDGFSKTFPWTIQQPDGTTLPDQTLLDLGIISMVLQYHGPNASGTDVNANATFVVDANPPAGQPRWSLDIESLSLAVFVQGFGTDPLLTIHGCFGASELVKAGFKNIAIDYGSALSAIKNILTKIQDVVEAIGGVVDLDVGFSGNQLTVMDSFALPTLPLGLGELSNIGLDLGLAITIPSKASFTVGFASPQNPFTWIVDPLSGNGAIQLGTTDGDIDCFIEAGIGVALAIDLAIASGGASVVLDFSLNVAPPDVTIAIALTGNANVDVLDGLASASLTLSAAISVEIEATSPPEADFTADCSVGIHISICWVISIDFDGSWSFSQTVPLHA
jgi:hypothetical protein